VACIVGWNFRRPRAAKSAGISNPVFLDIDWSSRTYQVLLALTSRPSRGSATPKEFRQWKPARKAISSIIIACNGGLSSLTTPSSVNEKSPSKPGSSMKLVKTTLKFNPCSAWEMATSPLSHCVCRSQTLVRCVTFVCHFTVGKAGASWACTMYEGESSSSSSISSCNNDSGKWLKVRGGARSEHLERSSLFKVHRGLRFGMALPLRFLLALFSVLGGPEVHSQ